MPLFDTPQPGDIGWLIAAHGRNYAEQFHFDQRFEIDIAKKVIAFLEKTDSFKVLFIAKQGNLRTGSVAVSLLDSKTAFINFLLVEPSFRQQGIALQMMEKVIHHCTASQIEKIQLETYSCLKEARNLYARFGFTIYKVNRNISLYGHVFDQEFWKKTMKL